MNEVEFNKRLAVDWLVQVVLPKLEATGDYIGTDPWPMTGDDVADVFTEVMQNPRYQDGQTLRARSRDGFLVTGKTGTTTKEPVK